MSAILKGAVLIVLVSIFVLIYQNKNTRVLEETLDEVSVRVHNQEMELSRLAPMYDFYREDRESMLELVFYIQEDIKNLERRIAELAYRTDRLGQVSPDRRRNELLEINRRQDLLDRSPPEIRERFPRYPTSPETIVEAVTLEPDTVIADAAAILDRASN